MMQNTAYRLAEYKIIENEHGDLWWETHIGFSTNCRNGKKLNTTAQATKLINVNSTAENQFLKE
jgi:hypothetical protein